MQDNIRILKTTIRLALVQTAINVNSQHNCEKEVYYNEQAAKQATTNSNLEIYLQGHLVF